MKLLSFFTKPIQFKNLADLEAFVEHYSKFHVHPTNFISSNGIPIHTELNDEPFDGNQIYGNALQFDVSEDNLTVVMSGEGGFSLAEVREVNGYHEMSPVVGDLIKDVFDERFHDENPDFEIYVTDEESTTGELTYDTVILKELYSQEAIKARVETLSQDIRIIQHKIGYLQQQEAKKEKERKELESKLVEEGASLDDLLPF